MIKKFGNSILRDPMWLRVLTVSLIFFFVCLGDAILSDWVPSFMQTSLGSPILMGLVFSFSSVIGFLSDLIFPQLFRKYKSRRLILLGIAASLIFSGVLFWTIVWPLVLLFLFAMAIWGVYYELLGFGSSQFVSDAVPVKSRSGVWATIGIFRSLAYFFGPILGSWLLISRGNETVLIVAASFACISYLILVLTNKKEKLHENTVEPAEKFNVKEELGYWKVLFEHVWPVLLISLMMGLIDATFWTTGAVFSDNMAKKGFLGGLFLPLYMLPPVFLGIVLTRWGLYKGKKKMAEYFLLLAGAFLACLGWGENVYVLLLLSFMIGASLSVSYPMVEAVYSDILARMGKEKKHMIGLSSSTMSIAYIIGPIAAGIIASRVGERLTFVVVGALTVVVAVVLLIVTPKKLKLPQTEMAEWKD